MSRTRLVATTISGLIILATLATPSTAYAVSSPQAPQATSVVQLGNAQVVKTNSVAKVVESAVADSSVTVTPWPSQYGSLSGISTAFYGSPGYWPGLCQVNSISNCDNIQIGQQVTVPSTAPVGSVATRPAQPTTSRSNNSAPAPANSGGAQAIVNYALAQVGKPYSWAAAGPNAFDCSGLVMMALRQVGVYVPHQDQSILYSGQGYPVSRANLQPGDVVWPYVGHVFIYIGNDRIVEAAGYGQGVKTNNLYAFWQARRYV